MEGDERGRAREREAVAGRRPLDTDGEPDVERAMERSREGDFSVLFELLKADACEEVAGVLICAGR